MRIHLIDLPRMIEDIVRDAFADRPVELQAGLPGRGGDPQPAIVIAPRSVPPDGSRWLELWRARPDIPVLEIEAAAACATLYEVWPRARMLGPLDEARLREVADAVVPWEERVVEA